MREFVLSDEDKNYLKSLSKKRTIQALVLCQEKVQVKRVLYLLYHMSFVHFINIPVSLLLLSNEAECQGMSIFPEIYLLL